MKKRLAVPLLAVMIVALGLVLSGGCGAGMNKLSDDGGGEFITDDFGNAESKLQTYTFLTKGTGADGEDEQHSINGYTQFNAIEDWGNADFSGATFIVESFNSSFGSYPIKEEDPLFDKGVARGNIFLSLEGSFVPGNGKITEAMEELTNIPIGQGGSSSDSETPEPVEGCEKGDVYSPVTGEECPDPWSLDRLFEYGWYCNASYNETVDKDGQLNGSSYANCSVHINGGTILRPYVNVGQIDNERFRIEITWELLITNDYEEPKWLMTDEPIIVDEGKG